MGRLGVCHGASARPPFSPREKVAEGRMRVGRASALPSAALPMNCRAGSGELVGLAEAVFGVGGVGSRQFHLARKSWRDL